MVLTVNKFIKCLFRCSWFCLLRQEVWNGGQLKPFPQIQRWSSFFHFPQSFIVLLFFSCSSCYSCCSCSSCSLSWCYSCSCSSVSVVIKRKWRVVLHNQVQLVVLDLFLFNVFKIPFLNQKNIPKRDSGLIPHIMFIRVDNPWFLLSVERVEK